MLRHLKGTSDAKLFTNSDFLESDLNVRTIFT